MIMYEWLLDFYMTYFDATSPLPDYIDKALHWFAFGMLLLVIFTPLIFGYLLVKTIHALNGRGYND